MDSRESIQELKVQYYSRYTCSLAQSLLQLSLSWIILVFIAMTTIIILINDDFSSQVIPLSILITHTILMIIFLIFLFISSRSFLSIKLISFLIGLSTSVTVLITSHYYTSHSPVFLVLLLYFLQTSLPLPSPLGSLLALCVLTIHVVTISINQATHTRILSVS